MRNRLIVTPFLALPAAAVLALTGTVPSFDVTAPLLVAALGVFALWAGLAAHRP